jgi:hypothetical protein
MSEYEPINSGVPVNIRIAIAKRNKEVVDQQLYDLDLNLRVAQRIKSEGRINELSGKMGEALSALDVINEELSFLEAELEDGVSDPSTEG